MKSAEVYRLLREEVAPWARLQGFKRGEQFLSWHRPLGDSHVMFWFQVSRDGWDEYAGSQVVVEFQLAAESDVGGPSDRRRRLAGLLDAHALEELTKVQNQVIRSLPKPPRDYWILTMPALRRLYMSKFEPVVVPYSQGDDVWLRYRTAEDVRRWGRFVVRQLPNCIDQVESWTQ